MAPVVRPATAADHAAIASFTTDTFDWGDYVTDAFPTWLDDPASHVVVAVDDDDQAIAVSRATRLSDREVWLGGARVHPEHQRRGIGGALNEASVEWGRSWGAVVAGLLTDNRNEAAMGQVRKLGYRPVAHVFYAHRTLDPSASDPGAIDLTPSEGPQPLNRAPAVDVEPAYLTWSRSELARASHSMIPIRWQFRRVGIDDIARAASSGTLYEAPAGWVVIERDDSEAWIPWLVTIADDAYSFVRAIAARLVADGVTSVGMLLPEVPWLVTAATQAGFETIPHTIWQLALTS